MVYLPSETHKICGTKLPAVWPGDGRAIRAHGQGDQPILLGRALCLYATLFDMDERRLYSIRSGIETVETYARQTRATRPVGVRLKDEERWHTAVEGAVGQLADAGPTAPPPPPVPKKEHRGRRREYAAARPPLCSQAPMRVGQYCKSGTDGYPLERC